MEEACLGGRVLVFQTVTDGSDSSTQSLELVIRLAVGEVRVLRSCEELLGSGLAKLGQKLGAKLNQGKKLELMLQLLSVGETIAPETPAAAAWPLARRLRLCFPCGSSSHLPVHWNPPSIEPFRFPSDAPVVGVPLCIDARPSRCHAEDCQWTWQRAPSGKRVPAEDDWEDVGFECLYIPSAYDEGKLLRVCCQPPFPGEAMRSTSSKTVVTAAPDNAWRWDAFSQQPAGDAFRLLTYNVLADAYASTKSAMEGVFSYCSPEVLKAPRRRQLILRDFLQINADLAGLQEVDSGQLAAMAPLKRLGWDHMYTRKAGQSVDGCALFWRCSRFEAETEGAFEVRLGGDMKQLPGLDPDTAAALEVQETTLDVLAAVTTVAQGLLLRDLKVPGRRLLVANTHLFYHPNADHVRLLQLHMLLTELSRHAAVATMRGGSPVSVILLGDLNVRKGMFLKLEGPQPAYRMLRDGVIFADDECWKYSAWCPAEWRGMRWKNCSETCKNNAQDSRAADTCRCCRDEGVVAGYGTCPLCEGWGLEASDSKEADAALRLDLRLPLPLVDPNQQVLVTNFTADFQECLDYTLLDRETLQVVREINTPPLDMLQRETALPSTFFPSDHVPVAIDVSYR